MGKLMDMAVKLGKSTRPTLHCGICGEHGGDPVSVEFCDKIGLDYVSCSPYRVPIARLAAAQAAIRDQRIKRPHHLTVVWPFFVFRSEKRQGRSSCLDGRP